MQLEPAAACCNFLVISSGYVSHNHLMQLSLRAIALDNGVADPAAIAQADSSHESGTAF